MYKRYKDDIDYIIEREPVEGEGEIETKKRTVREVKEIAEGIDENLKVTTDAAVEHEDGRMPTLNVKIWIGKTNEGTTKILHTHYMKEVSSRAVINAASAHSMEMKKNVMVNEVCTILKNCSRYQEWEEVTRHVEYFMKRLQYSGYDQRFKYEVLRRALNRHGKRVQESTGEREQCTG